LLSARSFNTIIATHQVTKIYPQEPVGRITFSIVSSTSVAPDWDKKVKNKSHFRIHVIDGRSGGAFLIGASDG